MAFWPRDERNYKPTSKRRAMVKGQDRNYPNLESGLMGAATLLDDGNKQLKWTFVYAPSQIMEESNQTRLKIGKQINVFPSTRPISIQKRRGTIQQQAEQGANFLRTYLPDVEISSEIIRDRLFEETALARELEKFDPYSGNLVTTLQLPSEADKIFLIFPTGQTNRCLNYASIGYGDNSSLAFNPVKIPIRTFSTPIQHIVTSEGKDANLAIRTFGSTQLFSANPNFSSDLELSELLTITRQDTADEVIVDMKFLSSHGEMLFIGDSGTVFKNTIIDGGNKMSICSQEPPLSSVDGFWRLSCGENTPNYFVMSGQNIWQFDNRAMSREEFYVYPKGKHLLTSIENFKDDNILRLTSTDKIIWLDKRFNKKPLLAYAHGREYDRYISVDTVKPQSDHPLSFLTTRNNGLVTVYDVSCSDESCIQLASLPYLLLSEGTMYTEYIGQQFISHRNTLGLARLSEQDGLVYCEVQTADSSSKSNYSFRNEDIFINKKTDLYEDIGPLGQKEFAQVDLSSAYNAIFRKYFKDTKQFEEDHPDLVYELLDNFPSYMQNKEVPVESLLTTYDIIFRAGEEPERASRSDFLTGSVINSKRGYRALTQGRLSADLIKAPLHRSITRVLQHLDPEFPSDPAQAMAYFEKFNLSEEANCSAKTREFEKEAFQQLSIDLALSTDIYSDNRVVNTESGDQTLEGMTEALSLGNEPPPVEFGFLRPLEKGVSYLKDKTKFSSTPNLPLGVRLLLSDWDDTDADDYVYQDPYNAMLSSMPHMPHKIKLQSSSGASNLFSQAQSQRPPRIIATKLNTPSQVLNQRPPRIVPSNVLTARTEAPSKVVAQSQDRFLDDSGLGISKPPGKVLMNSSQEPMASTQILPGAYGGRPNVKKKPAKKRMGGF